MPFLIKATLEQIVTYLQRSGYFSVVMVGEPKSPPSTSEKLAAALFMRSAGVAQLTLNSTIESHVVNIRIYRNMLQEPVEEAEYELAEAVSEVSNDLLGDIDLGARVRAIDVGGIHAAPYRTDWGYVDVSGTMYRVADIVFGLIVDDSATLVA